jgi:tetratricopeptide (TPR) repeat protein/TolB-like protein/DNA-binding winged helix-turn-helix (wHTH) protein
LNADLLHGFYLGDLFVEPLKGQVTDRESSRHLPPKAAEVLVCLARKSGELVSHETLLECAWGEGQGSHEALSHAVGDIRIALGDHADDPEFIQTLPRVGYRLVVEPELSNEQPGSVVLGAQGKTSVEDIGLFENLQRRGVLETALAYLILGWLLIQVADIVFEQLHLPDWAATFVTVLVILGFPIALVLSWFLELHDGRATVDKISPTESRHRRFSRTYISIVSSLAIAGVIVAIYDQFVGLPGDESPPPVEQAQAPMPPPIAENSLAVLPFANVDGSRETQIFADGLVDDVINQLSRVSGLRVASRGDSTSLGPNTPSQEVRDHLRVGLFIEGSVEIGADEIRATVQLINSEDGFHLLSRRFDRPLEEFFELRDEITSLIVANVRVSLPPDLQASSTQPSGKPSLNAYVLYRQGIEASRQPTTIDTIATALGWFDAALTLDPEYAVAHAGKCDAYIKGYNETDDETYIERARSSCALALANNPNLDVVHTSLGNLYMATGRYIDAEVAYQAALEYDSADDDALLGLSIAYQRLNRPNESEAIIRRAIDMHPGNAALYNSLGVLLFEQGRFDEASRQYEYAVALRPDNMKYVSNLGSGFMLQGNFALAATYYQQAIDIEPTRMAHSNLGLMRFYTGDYDAAIEQQMIAIELQPNDHLSHANLGDMFLAAGRIREARQAYTEADELASRALRVNPNDPFVVMDLAWIKTLLEEHDEARRLIDRALQMIPDDPYVHYYNGLMLNRTGDASRAIEALRIAVQLGYPAAMLAGDPNLSNLRGDLRFREIAESPREERQ